MSDIANIPTKLDEQCSLINLIDENQCVGNSLVIVNNNLINLSSALQNLDDYSFFWNSAYTSFQANSGTWLIAASHIQQYNELWNSAYSTVQTLSSNWSNPFIVFYPEIILIDDWYTNQTQYLNNNLLNWITTNFPPQTFSINQLIYIQVNLYQTYPFNFTFNRELQENCAPNGGLSVSCNECGRPSRGCNHHGGLAGWGDCDNAFNHCGLDIGVGGSSFSCQGTGGKTLKIQKTINSTDTSIARILKFTYQNSNNNSWSFIS
jgi:hypothetical protein